MIDVGEGWRTGCGSRLQSAERVEELEESVWSVVRQEHEREDGIVYSTVVRPALMYGAETWTLKKAHANKWEKLNCYYGCAELRSWTRSEMKE